MATATLQISRMAQSQMTALRRIAQRDGMTTEEYVKQLIVDSLAKATQDRPAPFTESAEPFRKALQHKSEAELDALVNASRRRHRAQKNRGTK